MDRSIHEPVSSLPKGQIATILFLTVVHERRADLGRYQFSIDRCFTNVEQANERAGLLHRCNAKTGGKDVVRQGRDHQHGCFWISAAEEDDSHIRYFIEVRCLWMLGSIRTAHLSTSQNSTHYLARRMLNEQEYDLVGHVFVVAIHEPDSIPAMAFDGKPSRMPWTLESVHAACDNALNRADKVWQSAFRQHHGTPQRTMGHYGLCRFALLPKYPYPTLEWTCRALYSTGTQVRMERVKVTLPNEHIESFVPARAIQHNKPWYPLCPGRETKLLERYLQELRTTHEPDEDLPWEKDIADLEMVDRLRQKRAEDLNCQRAPPPLRRALNDILTNYTDAVAELIGRPVTPEPEIPSRSMQASMPATPMLRALSGVCRSFTNYSFSSHNSSTRRKLKRRSYYVIEPVESDAVPDVAASSLTIAETKAPFNPVTVEFRRTMLTSTFTRY